MKLIIAIIKPDRLEAVKQELYKAEVNLMTVSEVLGHGRQMGVTEVYRGVKEMGNLLRKVQLLIAVNDNFVERDDQGHHQGREDGRDRRRQDIRAAPGGVHTHKDGGTGRERHRLAGVRGLKVLRRAGTKKAQGSVTRRWDFLLVYGVTCVAPAAGVYICLHGACSMAGGRFR